MTFSVMAKECETCIFHTNTSPIDRERFEQLRAEWEAKGIVQECHVATIQHEQVACRGHFNRWLHADYPYPLDAIKNSLGFASTTKEDFVQVAQRLGWITFIEMSKE